MVPPSSPPHSNVMTGHSLLPSDNDPAYCKPSSISPKAQVVDDDDMSTLASAKSSKSDKNNDNTLTYVEAVWNEHIPSSANKDTSLLDKPTTVATNVSISETTTISKSSRCSRRFSKRLQAASTPIRVYVTCPSICVRRQGATNPCREHYALCVLEPVRPILQRCCTARDPN